MRNILFLKPEQVLRLHTRCIERFGGLDGVRDLGLFQSAMAMPQAQFGGEYLHRDIYEMAAAYLFHLCCNHAFHDGNKRVAVAATEVFLLVNGIELIATDDELERLTLGVAGEGISKNQIADFLKSHSRRLSK